MKANFKAKWCKGCNAVLNENNPIGNMKHYKECEPYKKNMKQATEEAVKDLLADPEFIKILKNLGNK